MVDTHDINRFEAKKRKALDRVSDALEENKISEQDAHDIRQYGIGDGNLAPSTMKDRLGHLRIIAEESPFEESLVEHEPHQINEVLFDLQGEKGWSDGTKRNYEKSIRAFYRHHDEENKAEEVELTSTDPPKFRSESIVLLEDLKSMIEEVENTRDKALLAVMWEGAYRLTALLSLRRKDYSPQGDDYGLITTPDAVGTKGAAGREKPITWSRGYLDKWLGEHPSEEPSSPLFCSYKNNEQTKGDPLSPQYVRGLIKSAGRKTNSVQGENIHPHSFRHGRATYLARNDYSEREIEHIMDWSRDTDQHSRYEHLLQEDKVNSILRRSGVDLDEEQEREQESTECPRCGSKVLAGSQYCPQCSLRLTDDKPPWLHIYQRAVDDDDPYLDEIQQNPRWNMHELRPEIYHRVRDVVIEVLEMTLYPEFSDKNNAEFDIELDPDLAEKWADDILTGSLEEHLDAYPAEKSKTDKLDELTEAPEYSKPQDLNIYSNLIKDDED